MKGLKSKQIFLIVLLLVVSAVILRSCNAFFGRPSSSSTAESTVEATVESTVEATAESTAEAAAEPASETVTEGKLMVHYLDVGQGDSIFIELPNGEAMLIDSGENHHGEGIIEYIENEGYNRIDYLVGTHPHSDHIGSMAYIVNNFDIGSIYLPKVSANTKQYESLLSAIQNKGLTVKNGKAGVNVVSGTGFSADIIAPLTIDKGNLNNCSIVLKIVFGTTSFLFTGDAETGEMNDIDKGELRSDVLKAGHHGSKTSTTNKLIKKIKPEFTVISCGKGNEYGHPHSEVLKALEKTGSRVYRTDKDQTIIIISDGREYTVKTGNDSIAEDD